MTDLNTHQDDETLQHTTQVAAWEGEGGRVANDGLSLETSPIIANIAVVLHRHARKSIQKDIWANTFTLNRQAVLRLMSVPDRNRIIILNVAQSKPRKLH